MRSWMIAAALMFGFCGTAQAADITVLSAGVATSILRVFASGWTQVTGNKVTFVNGSIGKTRDNVLAGMAGDVVVLPPQDMTSVDARLKPGSSVTLGRAAFGLVVKAGTPHPDISTPAKLAAMLKAAPALAYSDPAIGSVAGRTIAELLKHPEFAGVKTVIVQDSPAGAILKGRAPYAAGAISEEVEPGCEPVPFPAALGLHIDFSGAVLAGAASPADAAAFLAYIARPEARPIWTEFGVAMP